MEEENKQLQNDKALQIQMNKRLIEEGIPISVIQNKIDKLEKEMEEAMADGYMHINYEKLRELANKKDILQDLLEERNK